MKQISCGVKFVWFSSTCQGCSNVHARPFADSLSIAVPASCAYTHIVVAVQPTLLALAGGGGVEGSSG